MTGHCNTATAVISNAAITLLRDPATRARSVDPVTGLDPRSDENQRCCSGRWHRISLAMGLRKSLRHAVGAYAWDRVGSPEGIRPQGIHRARRNSHPSPGLVSPAVSRRSGPPESRRTGRVLVRADRPARGQRAAAQPRKPTVIWARSGHRPRLLPDTSGRPRRALRRFCLVGVRHPIWLPRQGQMQQQDGIALPGVDWSQTLPLLAQDGH
jgi:hypothetical protein